MLFRSERRIHGMLDYANENSICRSRQLLYYFREEKSEDCGMCDVCLAKRKSNGIIEDKELNKKLIAFLKKQPATIEDICMQFKMKQDQMLPIFLLFVSDELLVYDVDDNTFKAN